MDWKLELVAVPVSDVDRAKAFYADQVGFNLDQDNVVNESLRFIQLTPHGSACSISIGLGITEAEPGSVKGLQQPARSSRVEVSKLATSRITRGAASSSSAIQTATAGPSSSSPPNGRPSGPGRHEPYETFSNPNRAPCGSARIAKRPPGKSRAGSISVAPRSIARRWAASTSSAMK
jgi:catechol 2,3-dioxygenase-like lactoylglutathione lyase family enzyme